MRSLLVVALALCAVHCNGFIFRHVTWGINPLSSTSFVAMPLTENDAKSQGFQKISDCGDSSGLHGIRYVKDNDMNLILIYDVQGHIAGISAAVPTNMANGWPHAFLKGHPFIKSGNHHHISAYFVDPAIICASGRTTALYHQQGVGTDLYIQNGTDPIADSIKIPHLQSGITSTHWTKGKCFPTMGLHYWYNIRKDMSCDEFYPSFLLYNGGKLNAFGWAFIADLTSSRLEHPPQSAISFHFTFHSLKRTTIAYNYGHPWKHVCVYIYICIKHFKQMKNENMISSLKRYTLAIFPN
ncbi:unnamed protein product [Mytilus edulis]|uniref:Uncharacterized protein n=1 Tax=Mytilus edulis TaxID=6550 RepID=A0A8S3R4L3_MYTED|nr:unnamed protein product [Mytilus edulis]